MSGNNAINENQGTQQPENITPSLDISKLLERVQISTDETTLQNLEESLKTHPGLRENLRADMDVLEKNPSESEKSRFGILYLKGYGQRVTLKDGRVMSFVEIGKLQGKEKDTVIDGMSRSEKIKFKEWELEVANQEEKKIDTNIQVANQEKVKFSTELEQEKNRGKDASKESSLYTEKFGVLSSEAKKLMDAEGIQFLTSELQKIESNPESSPIAQKLISQGATIEDIKSGKYNAVLEAHIIVAHETQLTPKDENKAREFHTLVNQMRDGIGVPPTPANIDRFLGSKVLGENREAVGTAMHEIGKTGNYDRMTWDEGTRKITFSSPRGEEVEIDTVSTPPRMTRSSGPLAISREIASLSPSERRDRAKRQDIKKLETKGYHNYQENISLYVQGRTAEYSLPKEIRDTFARENGKEEQEYEMFEQLLMTEGDTTKRKSELESMSRICESMRQHNLSPMSDMGETNIHAEIDRFLEVRRENLRKMIESNLLISEADTSLKTLSETKTEDCYEQFYRVSGQNLRVMREIGLHKTGSQAQAVVDRIIAYINGPRDERNQIQLDKKSLDSGDKDILKYSLEKLGGTSDILTSEKIGDFQESINMMLVKNPGSPGSIEEKLGESDTIKTA